MNLNKLNIIIWLLLLTSLDLKAAKPDSILITPTTNIGDIGWFYQFTFIHKPPRNKVDELVLQLKPFMSSSAHFNLSQWIESLGAIRSKESYALLYLLCCQPMQIKHITAFNSLAGSVQALNGFKVLNKYYLNNEVNSKLPKQEFDRAVVVCCIKKPPTCYFRLD